MNENSQIDHLHQLQRAIGSVPNTVVSLGELVTVLEVLHAALEGESKEWNVRFHDAWASLEEVYAVALDRGEVKLDDEFQRIVAHAISELGKLLEERV